LKLLFRTSRTEHGNGIREIAPYEVGRLKPHPLIIDIREEREYLLGHIEGSVHVSRNTVESTVLKVAPDLNTAIVIYCAVGNQCASGAEALRRLGYRNIFSLKGGLQNWLEAVGFVECGTTAGDM
jgi:rhodanese-related sulfurtransferase